FTDQKIPLNIIVEDETFMLVAQPGFVVRIFSEIEQKSGMEPRLEKLKHQFQDKAFTSEAAAKTLGVTLRMARKLLAEAIARKLVVQISGGRGSRYRIQKTASRRLKEVG